MQGLWPSRSIIQECVDGGLAQDCSVKLRGKSMTRDMLGSRTNRIYGCMGG